jgi:hypothetical protein
MLKNAVRFRLFFSSGARCSLAVEGHDGLDAVSPLAWQDARFRLAAGAEIRIHTQEVPDGRKFLQGERGCNQKECHDRG